MIIKCGRREFDLNSKDIIMFNGACYQIITRKIPAGWHYSAPILAKGKAEKMIRNGTLKVVKKDNSLVYFKIASNE